MEAPTTMYALGSIDPEMERLDRQSASVEAVTRLLPTLAGAWARRR